MNLLIFKMNKNEIEITAPVGSYASLRAAIDAGADSIYFGAGKLNMRSRSSANFDLNDLAEIVAICKADNVKSYLALNTIVYDEELETVRQTAQAAKKAGIDALIVSDIAALKICSKTDMPVHASTQLNICNTETVRFFSKYCDVIVLARELSLRQIKKIAAAIKKERIKGPSGELVKLEAFVHGALCMSIAGKCFLSQHQSGASANRGECYQPCRRKYLVKEEKSDWDLELDGQYIMSPKDLCTIGFLDKILEAEIKILKIEGRARSAEYVKRTTECYREAVDSIFDGTYDKEKIADWEKRLSEVFNRGFWDAHYFGKRIGEWTDRYGSKAERKKEYLGKAENYYSKVKVGVLKIENGELRLNDKILIIGPTTGVLEREVEEIRVDKKNVEKAAKGDVISIPLDKKIRPSDKLYKFSPSGK